MRAPSLQRAANAGQKEIVTAIGVLPLAGVANIVAAARPTGSDILGARRASTAGPRRRRDDMADQPSGFGARSGPMADAVSMVATKLQAIADATLTMLEDAAAAPGRLAEAGRLLTDNGAQGSVVAVLGAAAGAIATALLLALGVRRLLRPARARLRNIAPVTAERTAMVILQAVIVDAIPPSIYLAAGLFLDHLLFGPLGRIFAGTEVFRMVTSAFIINSAIAWYIAIVLQIPIASKRPNLRLVSLDAAEARRARTFVRRVVAIALVSWLVAESLFLVWLGDGVPRLILIAAAAVIGFLCLRALHRMHSHFVGFMRFWHILAVASVFALFAIWTLGLVLDAEPPFGRVLATLAILTAMPLLYRMDRFVLARIKRRMIGRVARSRRIYIPKEGDGDAEELRAVEQPFEGAELAAVAAETDRALDGFAAVMQSAFGTVLAIVAALLLARTWSLNLVGMLAVDNVRSWLGMVVDAAATLLVGWYVWRFFEAALTLRLSREEGGAESRARTVQPLLHSVGKGVIGAVALMGAFSALGLNIAPLLASAGVVGIAIGFGAQTLVKDLFSGACFLIEDVFRIGDYIEGGTAKGTVEKITFRTVALRHQNGPLHFVPYGSLGSVRNNSRDWVIDKFEIPLPISVQSERIRKMVKKIGEEMMSEPEFAAVIMMPLKAKLYAIQPGAKIFRCKVQTPPGRQFEIRTEAYRRIEAALSEAGIAFADPTPQVTVHNTLPGDFAVPPARAAE
jgi:small-conductance mechanosensitive channel